MRILTKLIVCVFTVQFTVSCAASLTEQCKQIKSTQNVINEASLASQKEANLIKHAEILNEAASEGAKKFDNLSITDNALKVIQKRLVENNKNLARIALKWSNIAKELELLDKKPKSTESLVSIQNLQAQNENIEKDFADIKLESSAIDANIKKICLSQ